MENAKKKELVEFIYQNFTKNGKKIPKKELNSHSKEALYGLILVRKMQGRFEEYLNRPKLFKYMVDGIQDGKSKSWDCEFSSEEECRKVFNQQGIKIGKVVEAKSNHRCRYCNGISKGKNKDILCDTCRNLFHHKYYSEL